MAKKAYKYPHRHF